MSFGSSIGDIITVSRIAWTVYKSCKDAPKDFQLLSGEVSRLHIVLKETEDLLSEEALTLEKGENLQDIVEGCRCVLSDIEELLEKFNRLGSNSRRTFDRLRWSHEEASALRDRITASAGLLTAFNSAVQVSSLARLQRTLDSFISEVRGGLREKSVVSSLTDDTIPIEQKEGWRQIRKELEDMGIPTAILLENKRFIIRALQQVFPCGIYEENDTRTLLNRKAQIATSSQFMSPEINSSPFSLQKNSTIMQIGTAGDSASTQPSPVPTAQKNAPVGALESIGLKTTEPLVHRADEVADSLLDSIQADDMKMVRLLILGGANVNAMVENWTALHYAAQHSNDGECVRLLLDHGADISATTATGGCTSLHLAVQLRNIYTAETLLEYGADPDAVDDRGWRPLHYAAICAGKEAFIRLLHRHGADVNSKTQNSQRSALHNAASYHDNTEVVRLLLELGATVACRDQRGRVPLHEACHRANWDIVLSLLNHGASLDDRSRQLWTPLHFAVKFADNHETIRLLLRNGADLSAQNNYGHTPLHLAALRNCIRLVCLLLEFDPDINSVDIHGKTPLHCATSCEVYRTLARSGADEEMVTAEGLTARQVLKRGGILLEE